MPSIRHTVALTAAAAVLFALALSASAANAAGAAT
jgi:hypothetical protein